MDLSLIKKENFNEPVDIEINNQMLDDKYCVDEIFIKEELLKDDSVSKC